MKKIIKSFGLEMKDFDESKGVVAFYFGAFSKDLENDTILPTAYTKTLAENKKNFYHNRDHKEAIGKPIEMGIDSKGAYCISQLALNTISGKDAYEQYKAGLMTGHSQEFQTIKDEYDTTNKTRVIKELRLWGVTSVTNIPANLDTPTMMLKSLSDCEQYLARINNMLKNGNPTDELGEKFLTEYKTLQDFMNVKFPHSVQGEKKSFLTDEMIGKFSLDVNK